MTNAKPEPERLYPVTWDEVKEAELDFGRARGRDEYSSIKAVPAGLPNKVVQADTPNVLSFGDTGPPGTGDIFLGRGVRLNEYVV